MKTIRARVNKKLLAKAGRLFTGEKSGRVAEVLQNARRAGATFIEISNADGWVTVRDNGKGVDEFAKLLDMGGSGWDDPIEQSEDPAGVGLFCLAPRELTIRSRGQAVFIGADDWLGKPVAVKEDRSVREGTELRFRDDPWDIETVELSAVFSGLKVVVDNQECKSLPFVRASAFAYPWLGCRIAVCSSSTISGWDSICRVRNGHSKVLVCRQGRNFGCGLVRSTTASIETADWRLIAPQKSIWSAH